MVTISRLPRLSLENARQLQFRLIDAISLEFHGETWLTRGELGVGKSGSGSSYTRTAERVLARMFGTEDAVFVTGAGTGAIRAALFALLPPLSRVLVHRAPLYATTAVTFRAAGYQDVQVDFADEDELRQALDQEEIQAVLIQHTRQLMTDSYQLPEVIRTIRERKPELLIVVDDNYAVANTPAIGVELGADVSAFSAFKLLGPEGVGIVLCSQKAAQLVRADMYSGGTRVQGFQAQDVLIGLSLAFVANAITQETSEGVAAQLNAQRFPEIEAAYVANMQSPIVLICFHQPIGPAVVEYAARYGAAPFPVGAMSRYELVPMIYRVSGTMLLELGEEEARHWIRLGPMRSGVETILNILAKTLKEVAEHVS